VTIFFPIHLGVHHSEVSTNSKIRLVENQARVHEMYEESEVS